MSEWHKPFTCTEILAQLYLTADTQLELIINMFQLVKIHPELRFGQENKVPVATVRIIGPFPPPVGETAERTKTILDKMNIPSACQLEIVRLPMFLDIFIHSGKRETFRKIRIIPGIGCTAKIGVIIGETARCSPVIFDMYGKRRLPETQFAGNLPIAGRNSFAGIIHVDKKIGTSPFIRFKHFHRRGQHRTAM